MEKKLVIWPYMNERGQIKAFVKEYDEEPTCGKIRQDACKEACGYDHTPDASVAWDWATLQKVGEVVVRTIPDVEAIEDAAFARGQNNMLEAGYVMP